MGRPTRTKRPPLALLAIMPGIALLLSGIITAINVGVSSNVFFERWLWSFAAALPVLPIALVLATLVEKAFSATLATLSVTAKRIVVSLITACMIEIAIATAVTWSNLGLAFVFSSQWLAAFLQSLPIGLVIALTMNFIIKPRFLETTD